MLQELLCTVLLQTWHGRPASEAELKALMKADLPWGAFGVIISVIGLSALAVHFLASKSKERLLLWFSLFAGLYGIRLLGSMGTTHWLFGGSRLFWDYLHSFIDYLIVIPSVLFFEEIYGRGLKSSLRWLVWILAVYAPVAMLVDVVQGDPGKAREPTVFIILYGTVVVVLGHVSGYRPPKVSPDFKIFAIASFIFVLFVVHDHLVGANLLPWHQPVEPVGFFIFICCLGYVAARRFFTNERQLLAIEQEMESARRIQAHILPREVPKINGLAIAARYVPMAAVAGDFYDFLVVDERRVGMLVADVSGHGVPAALIASMIKVAVSSQASSATDPAQVISAMNHIFCRQLQGQYLTAGYLFMDVEKRRALYAGAAHPPLLLWRKATQKLTEIHENGLLLGFRSNGQYSNVAVDLQPGDRILLYTDGITEATNASAEFFGENRLKEFIRSHEYLPANHFADSLLQDLAVWSAAGTMKTQTDDLTLIVVDVES